MAACPYQDLIDIQAISFFFYLKLAISHDSSTVEFGRTPSICYVGAHTATKWLLFNTVSKKLQNTDMTVKSNLDHTVQHLAITQAHRKLTVTPSFLTGLQSFTCSQTEAADQCSLSTVHYFTYMLRIQIIGLLQKDRNIHKPAMTKSSQSHYDVVVVVVFTLLYLKKCFKSVSYAWSIVDNNFRDTLDLVYLGALGIFF